MSTTYYCPMLCEGDKDYLKAGSCPVCGMFLVNTHPKPDLTIKNSHSTCCAKQVLPLSNSTATSYNCPMLCEGDKTYSQQGRCPVCGMLLVALGGHEERDTTAIAVLKQRLYVSVGVALWVLLLAMGHHVGINLPINTQINHYLQGLFTTVSLFYSGGFIIQLGVVSLKNRQLNMFSLIATGLMAAYGYSVGALLGLAYFDSVYFESVAVIIMTTVLGQWLELIATRKTLNSLDALLTLLPKDIRVIQPNGDITLMPIEAVKVNEIVQVLKGEVIPLEGVVVSGNSKVNESLLTGENRWIDKTVQDSVVGGSLNETDVLLVKVTSVYKEGVVYKLAQAILKAQSTKLPIQNQVDTISRYFTPLVFVIALVTYGLHYHFNTPSSAFSASLSVLIIACPCALGLATPLSLTVALGALAKRGLFIKNPKVVEQLNTIKTVITDKTGTLTEGQPTLQKIINLTEESESTLATVAYSLELKSEHVLAKAFTSYAKEKSLQPLHAHCFEHVTGKGLSAVIDDKRYYLGNAEYQPQHLKAIELLQLNYTDSTLAYLSTATELLGVFVIQDALKQGAVEAISQLKASGFKVTMLTGDRHSVASAVAVAVGIDSYESGHSPQTKELVVKTLQAKGERVMFVGDGINDALALTTSDVSVAMQHGSDMALATSDVVVLKGDITKIPFLLKSGLLVLRNIHQNLFLSFIYNSVGIAIATGLFGGTLSPMIAGVAMMLSSLMVILNSLRLNRLIANA